MIKPPTIENLLGKRDFLCAICEVYCLGDVDELSFDSLVGLFESDVPWADLTLTELEITEQGIALFRYLVGTGDFQAGQYLVNSKTNTPGPDFTPHKMTLDEMELTIRKGLRPLVGKVFEFDYSMLLKKRKVGQRPSISCEQYERL
jgi:hypothetical protein